VQAKGDVGGEVVCEVEVDALEGRGGGGELECEGGDDGRDGGGGGAGWDEAESGRAVESWWEWEVGEVGRVIGGAWVVDLWVGGPVSG
jgi:hypothetical protein